MYLVVDCETNGLPVNRRAPIEDLDNWPRAAQIAWGKYDASHQLVASASRIVRPDGFDIPASAAKVHGITTAKARKLGFPIRDVLWELHLAANDCQYFIAHNANFDGSVLAAEFLRQGWQPPFVPRRMICTMQASTDYLRIPGPYGNKWPTLDELYGGLFQRPVVGAHDAGVDAAVCACCFFELKNRGVIEF